MSDRNGNEKRRGASTKVGSQLTTLLTCLFGFSTSAFAQNFECDVQDWYCDKFFPSCTLTNNTDADRSIDWVMENFAPFILEQTSGTALVEANSTVELPIYISFPDCECDEVLEAAPTLRTTNLGGDDCSDTAVWSCVCGRGPFDPSYCTVLPADHLNGFVLSPQAPSPSPASINTITVKGSAQCPFVGASVVVILGASNVLCGSTVLTGTTDDEGVVVITLGGGGCAHNLALAGIVKANGITIRSYNNVKSPDYDGAQGDESVNLPDLIAFSREFLDDAPNRCHDYDNDGNTGLGDLIIFSPAFTGASHCP